ncbi:Uncharacterized protein APZ42_034228 [Daphnia magna]|uniref:Ty3 transposon capsid-like protein domain-containing protein n=1 Tax=Daphnia magna TaxID=35525 RepID=A0A164KAX3_9CRUS|nr:Uncharacterized protein APZ42_034228 [Daphnia magna]
MAASVSSRHKRRRIQKKLVTDSAFYEENAEKHSIATESVTEELVYWQIHSLETITFGGPNDTVKNNNKTLEEKFLICASFASCKCSTLLSPSLQATDIGTPSSVLQKESVIALIEDKKQISTLKIELSNARKQLESNKKKAKSSKYTLSKQKLETTLATESQLQNLLKRKEENNAAVETEGQEIINKLEGEKTRLIQKLSTAENQIKQASTEKINLKKNLLDFTSKNKNLEKDLQELQDRVRRQENQIIFLENRVKEYKKLQVKSIETEDSNDSRLDEDELGEITKLVGDINELTLPTYSGDKSLHYELEIEQTNDFEQTIENLKTQIEHLNKTIIYLEQENQQLKKKVDMGVTHDDEDTSEKTFANTCKKNPKDDNIPATEQDDEDAKKVNRYFTQPIVKALGELFSREDKKATRIFKEKSTDWLRGAEHVARNNEWDDNQKIRFFSDRLKGEAFEWHENYVEEEGDDLNYQDWKEALISRFQDTYDLASLEKKLSKLTQKPEENCRAFMRDHRKSKILPQELLPKYKAELYLRMPENTEDYEALCKQLFISEKILHTTEATDDKEMSAVIAGITHHEKQQDDKIQLLEQKLSEALSELKCTNTKRGSSQENDVTIAATDQYEKGRPRSSERYSRSRDSRVRFADSHNRRESSRERSLSRKRDNGPYRRNYNSSGRRNYNPSGYRQTKIPSHQRPPYRNDYPNRQGNYNGPNNYRHQARYNNNQHLQQQQVLRYHKYKFSSYNSLGETPLMVAIAYGHEEVASYLWISSNVAQMAKDNSTVLHYAAKNGNNSLARAACERKIHININQTTRPGNYTALHLATMYSQDNIINILLEHGANTNITDVNGNTPRDYAFDGQRTNLF